MAENAVKMRIRITHVTDGDELARQLEGPMLNLGNAIVRRMRRLVPKRTWVLHDSIVAPTVERVGAAVTVTTGAGSAKAHYWEHVEKGTSRMRAQPYLRPALLQSSARDLKGGTK